PETAMLTLPGAKQEQLARKGLRFVRRKSADGFFYFLANRSDKTIDEYVPLGTIAESALIYDPRFENRIGTAELLHHGPRPLDRSYVGSDARFSEEHADIHLQLLPGESCIVRTFTNKVVRGPMWP